MSRAYPRKNTPVRTSKNCDISDWIADLWHFLPLVINFQADSTMALDRFDRAILSALQKDGRTTNVQLAARVNLSESACLRRVRALEESGLIDCYVAMISQSKVGLPGNVFVNIGLQREEDSELSAFEEAVRGIPEVMECYLMTGEVDYLLGRPPDALEEGPARNSGAGFPGDPGPRTGGIL
jgi:DNA-binding Lrp family transcriptional regulator